MNAKSTNETSDQWRIIDPISADSIFHAREQTHQAVQLVASVGRAFLPSSREDDQASLVWLSDIESLAGHWVGTKEKYRAALLLQDLSYLIIDRDSKIIATYDLPGKNQDEAFNWFKRIFSGLGFNNGLLSLQLPYAMPIYPTSKGERFKISRPLAFKTLSDLFNNAHLVLQQIRTQYQNTSGLSCWPHHFDMAFLISLDKDQEVDRSIGMGFSPGDQVIPEPYFYVNCWPYPELAGQELPEISTGGKWNLDGWIGTTLRYSDLLQAPDQQHQVVLNFFTASYSALQLLYGS